jgi:hypothetical protein
MAKPAPGFAEFFQYGEAFFGLLRFRLGQKMGVGTNSASPNAVL